MRNPRMSPLYSRAWAKATRAERLDIIERLKPKPPEVRPPEPPVEPPVDPPVEPPAEPGPR